MCGGLDGGGWFIPTILSEDVVVSDFTAQSA